MKERKSSEQIIRALREMEDYRAQGMEIKEACRQIGVSDKTYYRWKAKYGAMTKSEAKRLLHLESENSKLKRMVADQLLTIEGLRELSKGNF